MRADTQRDGGEYRWRPVLNAVEQMAKNVALVQFRDEKMARRSQQLQDRRIRNMAVIVKKRRSL